MIKEIDATITFLGEMTVNIYTIGRKESYKQKTECEK